MSYSSSTGEYYFSASAGDAETFMVHLLPNLTHAVTPKFVVLTLQPHIDSSLPNLGCKFVHRGVSGKTGVGQSEWAS